MTRHTTFRFSLDPTVEQEAALWRHVGASRFAYNQCLELVESARKARRRGADVPVPRTGYDLIKHFTAWKNSAAAGRVIAVDSQGAAEVVDTGLVWRREVYQQVFEEAAVDLGRGLAAWSASRPGERAGRPVRHPRFKKKGAGRESFARLSRYYARTARIRRHHAHQVSNRLVKTHDRLALEHLNVHGMLDRNPHLAATIGDVGWRLITTQIAYKQAWRGGEVAFVDRWFPSSRTCSACRSVQDMGGVAVRTFRCRECGLTLDRDLNAAVNLAAWAETHHGADAWARDLPAAGPVTNAHRRDRTGRHHSGGATGPKDVGTGGRAPSA